MSYYFNKKLNNISFEDAISRVTEELKSEGFGILTDIDVKGTFKNKLNVDFKKYRILGACNPHYAYKAIQSEDKIGVFLPCSIIVEEQDNGEIEITSVDPVASMIAVKNDKLGELALEVRGKLKKVIDNL